MIKGVTEGGYFFIRVPSLESQIKSGSVQPSMYGLEGFTRAYAVMKGPERLGWVFKYDPTGLWGYENEHIGHGASWRSRVRAAAALEMREGFVEGD